MVGSDFSDAHDSLIDDFDDAVVEDTGHCTVCAAEIVVGSNDLYVVLDPPGDQQEAAEHGCQQISLCAVCARKVAAEYARLAVDIGLTKLAMWLLFDEDH